ncbi:uncharacterized protein N7477_006494 [Penicillium maclennaniae]|uniref:uncharacterized protein n=1 Tax=Penicillium maclennaniae TaxID=1343394 RepID=UPI002541EA2C|nr:uncharacterized protein N7477_006494 [Penicillium maclennaniae]KAJ5667924.1 hypothetical protein N7477_006494 [Penicillium maclennaniae]
MLRSLNHLPDEILHSILCYCHPRSCVALEQTSHRFENVTNEPLLWRHYCQIHYKSWDRRHSIVRKLASPVSTVDWKALFILRYRIDRSATHLLDSILASQTGRIDKFRAVIDFGYDAKDTLLRHGQVEAGEDHLARRLASILHSIQEMLATIVGQFTAFHPDVDSLSPREKALELARWLQLNDFTGIEAGREYHSLEHNFLGLALRSLGHNSLPLISAAIYCYAAQELGLNAHPCGFPFHVHVVITPQPGFDMSGNALADAEQGSPMYLDPFRGARETPVSDLRDQLVFLASTSVDMVSAKYAALWSSMLLSGDSRPMDLRHQLPWLMELFATDFPSDIFLVEQYIVPLFHGLFEHEHILESLHVMRAVDEIPKQVHRRTDMNKTIRYRVGQVFRHRRYHYWAIITGWDSECGAGEQWMRRMGIDRLQAGRHQSFYHVLVEDRSVRYVAEENIDLILPRLTELPHSLTAIAGKHFKRWDEATRAFVSNVKDEYPDD